MMMHAYTISLLLCLLPYRDTLIYLSEAFIQKALALEHTTALKRRGLEPTTFIELTLLFGI